MKHNHGHKMPKRENIPVTSADETSPRSTSLDVSDNSDMDDDDHDIVVSEAAKQDFPAANQPEKPPFIYPERPIQRPAPTAVYGRVKVRLKTPKISDTLVGSSDPPMQNDTVLSNPQVGIDKQRMIKEKMEDSANSLPKPEKDDRENPSLRALNITIMTSKGSSSSISQNMDPSAPPAKKPHFAESRPPQQESHYSKQELESALEVIKKIMKMEAAEPFNVPVNPIELGIPDYFDVIDTPMDFGTIRQNLESGGKYKNSLDVYKDVQYIWENCFRYNNKGDYIVDLMKRVKKNFSKYWSAAGLHCEPRRRDGPENVDAGGPTSHEKKNKKGKGVKKHKDGCLCAICIMKRRRREREAREARESRGTQTKIGHSDSGFLQQEENIKVGSPFMEETSSYMDTSQDNDKDIESEDVMEIEKSQTALGQESNDQKAEESKLDVHDKDDRNTGTSKSPQRVKQSGSDPDPIILIENKTPNESNEKSSVYAQKQQFTLCHEGGHVSTLQRRKQELFEAAKRQQRAQLYESFQRLETSTLMGLCSSLFSNNRNSIWSGPHSLVRHSGSSLSKNSEIHAAVASFMTPGKRKRSSS